MQQLANLDGEARSWVALGHMLCRANRQQEALQAWKQGLWLHQQQGFAGRAATVAKLILKIDPSDRAASRMVRKAA
ncbi:MAG: hypothetical protein AAGE52_34535 [Myxococcota bacterium]